MKEATCAPARPAEEDRCACRIVHTDRVARAKEAALPPAKLSRLAAFFQAMADSSRLRILWALVAGEMCVCDLAATLELSESAVSHQLRTLRQLGLVANRRQGPVLYYRLDDHHVESVLGLALEHLLEER
ncbi:MAG: metalloregulator ArsR/SmtB family transcription factor [Thermodesulfobacteriota bacterium]